MGRHRADPMGIARLVLAGLAVLTLVVLLVLGALSLIGALGPERSAPAATVVSASSRPVPTVRVRCLKERCPTVFLRVAGGDVLFNREMTMNERVQFFDPKIDVVLADSASVRVEMNGVVRAPGKPGERQEFVVFRG